MTPIARRKSRDIRRSEPTARRGPAARPDVEYATFRSQAHALSQQLELVGARGVLQFVFSFYDFKPSRHAAETTVASRVVPQRVLGSAYLERLFASGIRNQLRPCASHRAPRTAVRVQKLP
jgi:hypothetical protein